MDRDALRQFAGRDWSAVDTSKTRHWRTLKTARPAADVLAIADRMRVHAQQIRPERPTPQQRLDDVRVHQRVGEALRAVTGTKLLAGREKDIDDVRGVLAERGAALDVSRIETTLGLLEDALGQSDLTPVLERELDRWRRSG